MTARRTDRFHRALAWGMAAAFLALGALPALAYCPRIDHVTPGDQFIEIAWSLDVNEATLVHTPAEEGDFAGYRVWLREDWTGGDYILLREYIWGENNPDATGYWDFEPFYIDSIRVFTAEGLQNAFPYTVSVTAFEVGQTTINDSCRTANARGPIYALKGVQDQLYRVQAIPNPYRSSADWESGGQRRVVFVKLPGRATIRIYTTAGDHVRTLEHRGPATSTGYEDSDTDQEPWDLKNEDGEEVAPGVYIWAVDAGDLGTKAGKIMIIK